MGKVTRREFVVQGGKYALFTGAAMQVLLTSARAAGQSGLARFEVGVEGHPLKGSFSGSPSTSPSGTWSGTSGEVIYNDYYIHFTGDTSHLPANVTVEVSYNGHGLNTFDWGTHQAGGSDTFTVPKTGGTVGNGGTVYDSSPCHRPWVKNTNKSSPMTGAVFFSATGVDTLMIVVSMPPAL